MKTFQLPQPLSQIEEKEIIERVQKGDEKAKDLLVEHNIRLVMYIANKYKNQKYDVEDLISIGSIGLIKAVETFNPDKKIKFATYASRCIQNEILMHIRKTKKENQEIFLEETVKGDDNGNSLSIIDTIGTQKEQIEMEIQKNDTIDFIKEIIDGLKEEERLIIRYRYGIDCEKRKQNEIAEIFNISQSYVSRIEKQVLKKIRRKYEKREKSLA